MKFIKFIGVTHEVATQDPNEPLPFFSDGEGNIILCAEISKADLRTLRSERKIYVLLNGFQVPPPVGIQAENPFQIVHKIDKAQNENTPQNQNESSAGNNDKPNDGDSKLSIA